MSRFIPNSWHIPTFVSQIVHHRNEAEKPSKYWDQLPNLASQISAGNFQLPNLSLPGMPDSVVAKTSVPLFCGDLEVR